MYVSQIYNYLNHDLVPKRRTRTHKASELKEVYNSISKYNQSSPLYLVDLSESRQTQMIDIKEQALTLRDVTEQLSDPDSDLYSKKQVLSDNPDAVTGSFRAHASGELPDRLTLQVEQLASEQVNIGAYLLSDEAAVSAGTYSFYMDTERGRLPFTVTVSEGDTNSSIQQQLAANINGRRLGIQASVVQQDNTGALMLVSSDTGTADTASSLYFSFGSDKSDTFIDTFGLNRIQTYPENARFYINDIIHSSASNHISINQAAEFDFLQTTDAPVTIDFSPDKGILTGQLQGFTDAYNRLVSLSETEHPTGIGSRNLYQDIAGIANRHSEELAAIGITVNKDHTLSLDTEQAQSVSYDTLKELFGSESTLRSDILASVSRLSLDPLAYVDRLIVTYPNADKKQTATYTQSVYSGLMYNNYA